MACSTANAAQPASERARSNGKKVEEIVVTGPRQAEVRIGVSGIDLQRLLERTGRKGKVVFLKGQISRRQMS